MKAVLKASLSGGDKEASGVPGLRTRTRSRPGRGGEEDEGDEEDEGSTRFALDSISLFFFNPSDKEQY